MQSRFKEYLRSLPVRIVVAGAVLGIALATRHYWPTQQEEPAPGATPGGIQSLYEEESKAALDAKTLREQSLTPPK